jgi:hypothetical protein
VRFESQISIYQVFEGGEFLKKFAGREGKKIPGHCFSAAMLACGRDTSGKKSL